MKRFVSFFIFLFFVPSVFCASVFVNPKFTVIDSNGDPLSGGLIYTYTCGTTTEKTTYTDYSEDTANANPVVLDSSGAADIYSSGCLKVIIKNSSDVTLYTIDNVQGYDSTVLQDADRDTKIQVEESSDEDIIRFDINGSQVAYINSTGLYSNNINFDNGRGALRRSTFSYKDDDEIYIGAGSYHHSGTSSQFVYWTSTITFEAGSSGSNADSTDLEADTWYYLYLDDTAIITQAATLLDADCFVLSSTAPTYSGSKFGWYNGSDRCIFAVLTDDSADILAYYHDGGRKVYFQTPIAEMSTEDIDTAWTPVGCSSSVPSFSTLATFHIQWWGGSSDLFWAYNGAEPTYGMKIFNQSAAGDTDQNATIDIVLDSSQIFELISNASSDDVVNVQTHAWSFPGGM